jgi:hypothetical protein
MATTTSGVSPVGNKFYTTTVTTNTDGSLKSITSRTDARERTEYQYQLLILQAWGRPTRTSESGATSDRNGSI